MDRRIEELTDEFIEACVLETVFFRGAWRFGNGNFWFRIAGQSYHSGPNASEEELQTLIKKFKEAGAIIDPASGIIKFAQNPIVK